MSFNFKELENKYLKDPAFNKMVNLFTQLISEHGFQPSELREGIFFSQYIYQMNHAQQIVRSEKEWDEIREMQAILRHKFVALKENGSRENFSK